MARGTATASRGATGFIFADYMLGLPSQSARVVAMADGLLRRSSYYAYIQDDWRITPKLTLNAGLRYETLKTGCIPWRQFRRSQPRPILAAALRHAYHPLVVDLTRMTRIRTELYADTRDE